MWINSALSSPLLLRCVLTVLLLPILLQKRNWTNALPGPQGWPVLGYLLYLTNLLHEDLFHLAKTYRSSSLLWNPCDGSLCMLRVIFGSGSVLDVLYTSGHLAGCDWWISGTD
ncbi:hypothetical protein Sjap_014596 [Stephania japonica]|uniref:Uncharacterized protein n=1 Tax=Stephania japonica TaxID=461633 RepID=A0AAP0IHJ5_9MAGN